MPALTKKDKINAEQRRVSQLTSQHDALFKLIFSHQVEKKYNFGTLTRSGTSNKKLVDIFRALATFLDHSTSLTITEAEEMYGRIKDPSDGTYDPETNSEVEIQHLCIFKKTDRPNINTDSIRLHGYFRVNGGYFVVTRMDWFHEVHK